MLSCVYSKSPVLIVLHSVVSLPTINQVGNSINQQFISSKLCSVLNSMVYVVPSPPCHSAWDENSCIHDISILLTRCCYSVQQSILTGLIQLMTTQFYVSTSTTVGYRVLPCCILTLCTAHSRCSEHVFWADCIVFQVIQ